MGHVELTHGLKMSVDVSLGEVYRNEKFEWAREELDGFLEEVNE